MSTLAQRWQINNEPESADIFLSQLAKLGVVDVGHIETLYEKGTIADVRLLGGECDLIRCEVIGVGSGLNYLIDAEEGQYVLVFYPRSAVAMNTRQVDVSSTPFSRNYAKCLPVGVQKGAVRLNSMQDSVCITGSGYNLKFQESQIMLVTDMMSMGIDIENGEVNYATKALQCSMGDEEVKIVKGAEYDSESGDITTSSTEVSVGDEEVKIVKGAEYDSESGDITTSSTEVSVGDEEVKIVKGFSDDKNSLELSIKDEGVSLVIGDDIKIAVGESVSVKKGDVEFAFVDGGIKITGNLDVSGYIKNPTLEAPKS